MKYRIALFIAVLITGSLFSQNPQWRWASRAGGSDIENGKCITVDQDGNIYILGDFESQTITFGNVMLSNPGFSMDIFLVKSDSSGNIIWAQRIGGYDQDRGESLTIDPAGNLLLTGTFYSDSLQIGSGVLISVNAGSSEVFIAKLDTAGNALWAVAAGGTSHDYSRGIAADDSGNIYVSGYFNSPSIAFGNIILNNIPPNYYSDGFIVKYNISGTPQWVKGLGGSLSVYTNGICTDAQANVYLIGNYESDSILIDNFTLYNNGAADAFLVKYDSSGIAVSAKNFGGNSYEYPDGICTDASGNIYITGGYSSTSITFGSTILNGSPGLGDIYIIKYDAAFNEGWIVNAGGPSYDIGFDITCDAVGNLYACGHFNDTITFGNTTLTSAFGADPFMVHCDSAGNVQWAVSARGNNHADAAYSVAIHNGAAYYTGYFHSTSIDFNNFSLANAGAGDVFIARLDTMQTVSTIEIMNTEETISLVPNPFSNEVLISFHVSHPDQTSLKIFDVNGKQVFGGENISWAQGQNHFKWNVSEANAGIYLLQLECDGTLHTKKLIVMK